MRKRLSAWSEAAWWRPAVRAAAVLAPFATCAILSGFRDGVTTTSAALILVLWVVAAAATGDRVAAILAAISGGLWLDFFLTEPYLRLSIADSQDVGDVVLLVLIGLAVTEVALWGHRQQADAARRSGYLDGVLGVARSVADGEATLGALAGVVARELVDVLDVDEARYVDGPVHDARVAVLDPEGRLLRGGRVVDVRRRGLPTDEYVAVLVRRGPRTVGHFLLSATSHVARPGPEQCRVAVLLADQVAAAVPGEAT